MTQQLDEASPIPGLRIIGEKSSLSTLRSSMAVSPSSRQYSTSPEHIREMKERIASQESDVITTNDRFQLDLNVVFVAQIQKKLQS